MSTGTTPADHLEPVWRALATGVQRTGHVRDSDHDTSRCIAINALAAVHAAGYLVAPTPVAPALDAEHLNRQRTWSRETFGPGPRTLGVIDHIRKELAEIEADPTDVAEWVDVVILALDGAWRAGGEPQEIIDAIRAKQERNEARTWPDWRSASPDQAIEHIRCHCDHDGPHGFCHSHVEAQDAAGRCECPEPTQ